MNNKSHLKSVKMKSLSLILVLLLVLGALSGCGSSGTSSTSGGDTTEAVTNTTTPTATDNNTEPVSESTEDNKLFAGGTGTAEHEEIYAGDGEDALGGLGGAADELSESDSMFSGSSRGLDLGSLFGGDSSGIDLDLSSLGSMFGGDGSGLNLGGLLGGGETAPVNTVPAENPEQFYGTWEISSLRVAGYEIGMDMLKQFGLDEPSSMTATLTADSVTFAETNGKTGTRAITAVDFSDGALTITLDSTPAKLQLTDTGNLLCTVSAAQYGIDASVDIIFTRTQ